MRVPNLLMVMTLIVIALAAFVVKADSIFPLTNPYNSKSPIPSRYWDEETKIWLARSCVGEIGFGFTDRPHEADEECVAIAWVYAKRVKAIRWPLQKVIRRYSAAVKPHSAHTRPWILGLNRGSQEPAAWPKNLRWSVHKPLWKQKLRVLDRWANGEIADPLPKANHYGGKMDARMAEYIRKWKRVPTPEYYLNRFYDSRRLTGTPRLVLRNLVVAGPPI